MSSTSDSSRSPQAVGATLVAAIIGTFLSVVVVSYWRSVGSPGFAVLSWWRILIVVFLASTAVSRMVDPFARVAPEKGWWGFWLLLVFAVVVATLPLVVLADGWFIVEAASAHIVVATSFGVVIPVLMRRK